MLARFFVDRPIFAWVIAIVIMLAGTASITSLPVAQYPDVAPPSVAIYADVSRRVRRDGREQRHAGSRAAADRARRPALLLVVQLVRRQRQHPGDVRAGHEPGHRAGAGAEQGAAGDLAPARRGAAARRHRHEVAERLPDDRGAVSTRPISATGSDIADLPRQQPAGPDRARAVASAACRCSARSTRCASGSIRRSSRRTA